MFPQNIIDLTKQLYPTGRAWKMPKSGWMETLTYALSLSETKAYNDALYFQNSLLPDNQYFSVDDATDWERRLGMIQQNTSVPLADRKAAILRKMNHPGTIKARQHYLYVEGQLRDAGFDVYVYENRFYEFGNWVTKNPIELSGGGGTMNELGDHQLADKQLGGFWNKQIVNSISAAKDASFNIGANFRSTFFIGGSPIGSYAAIPQEREIEFRQLVLKLKPCQTVAFLFIVYT